MFPFPAFRIHLRFFFFAASIWHKHGKGGKLTRVYGKLKQDDVSCDDSQIWGMKNDNNIWNRNGKNGHWTKISGKLE